MSEASREHAEAAPNPFADFQNPAELSLSLFDTDPTTVDWRAVAERAVQMHADGMEGAGNLATLALDKHLKAHEPAVEPFINNDQLNALGQITAEFRSGIGRAELVNDDLNRAANKISGDGEEVAANLNRTTTRLEEALGPGVVNRLLEAADTIGQAMTPYKLDSLHEAAGRLSSAASRIENSGRGY